MKSFLNLLRYSGLVVFAVGIFLLLLTLVNWASGFTDATWFQLYFIRLYLFLTVSGILLYILITFRRKDDKKKE
ncbi:hypothetical protein FQV26_02350 [Planococcus sp. CPCC 101016]|uniref:hypothetical protein n=1 Tax=Planococcus sp. CPCC 101016 TaxID=2599617 RepID=UPI0011B44FC2|nr:hypothetical protein [Planococcus sp. CPCC 101016]TWT06671.1 hypothetical protein FQV26_02350 [Planococcus sp. CPCC 101016]